MAETDWYVLAAMPTVKSFIEVVDGGSGGAA
jgi:hypothetical protein